MSDIWEQTVEHFNEEYAEIVYTAGMEEGNVDLRRKLGLQNNDSEEALANRNALLQRTLGTASAYVLQVVQMGSDILDLSHIGNGELAPHYTCDGLIIDRPGVILGLNTADCFGITMHDARRGRAIGLIHAGRQGTQAGIHIDAMYKLIDNHDIRGEDIRFNFSPGVHAKSYSFYPDIPDDMAEDEGWNEYIEKVEAESGETRLHIDVLGRLYVELIDEGVKHTQISLRHAIDVGADPRFYSHTRAHKTGEPFGRNFIAASLALS